MHLPVILRVPRFFIFDPPVYLRAIYVLFNGKSSFLLRRLLAFLGRYPVFPTTIHRILATNTRTLTGILTVINRYYLRPTGKFTGNLRFYKRQLPVFSRQFFILPRRFLVFCTAFCRISTTNIGFICEFRGILPLFHDKFPSYCVECASVVAKTASQDSF